jgi:nucleotide-binding universal stress UspA family protein
MKAQIRQPNPQADTPDVHLETTRLQIQRVLLATDFSESAQRASQWAAALARWFDAKLFLLNAAPQILYLGETGMDPALLQRASTEAAELQLKQLAASPEMHGLELESMVALIPPVEAIQQAIETHRIDLVVMGSHGASGLAKLALGSVAEAALRHSPKPVIIIGPKCELKPQPFKSILFATDLQLGSLRAAQYALSMAEENNAKITLLHVLPKSAAKEVGPEEAEMRKKMEALLPADADLWSQPSIRVEHGEADKQVLQVAQELKADLIVLGTREAGPLSDHLPWSTVSKIIRGASCPVMAVRAHVES